MTWKLTQERHIDIKRQFYEMILAAAVPGLIVGILALVLHKGFVICSTTICGGMPAGIVLGDIAGNSMLGLLLGVVLSALGIFVQFRMEKKDPAPKQNTAAAAANAAPAPPDGFTAPAFAAEQPAAPAAPENRFQSLETTVPTTYCPRGGVLTKEYSLSKDSKDDVVLTHESLADVLKNESMYYEEDTLSCEYLALSDEQITYAEGGQHAAVSAGFVWDDGQSSFEGILTMELDYTAGGWNVASVSYLDASHPAPNAATTVEQAAELLRTAIEEDGTITGEFVEVSVDSIYELGGYANLTAHYVVREGEYLRSTLVEGGYEYHAGRGYQQVDKPFYRDETLLPEQDISASLSTPYRIGASGATPVGVASSGSAQATVNINTAGTVDCTLNIGGLQVNMTGIMSGSTPSFSCSGATQNIMVRYSLILTTEAEIPYTASGNLSYEDGTLSGTIVFNTVAFGVDSFTVTLGN